MKQPFHTLLMLNYTYFQKEIYEKVKPLGLTMGQPKILDYLSSHDGANQKEIAMACNIEPGSLTSLLNRMEDRGIIVRKILNNNRRTYHIFLTEKGKELQLAVSKAFVELETQAFAGMSEEEKELFMNIFSQINDNLKKERKY